MIIIELNEGEDTLKDIERISRHFKEHDDFADLVTEDQLELIEGILEPTLATDGHEFEKKELWHRLLNELVITDKDGTKLQFFRDIKHNRLYFGSQEGFDTITELAENEDPIASSNRRH